MAKICFETKQTVRRIAVESGLSTGRLAYAMVVLDYASDLVDGIISGAVSLDTAYATARERKDAALSDEGKLAALRSRYPKLADKVTEGELALAEARLSQGNVTAASECAPMVRFTSILAHP